MCLYFILLRFPAVVRGMYAIVFFRVVFCGLFSSCRIESSYYVLVRVCGPWPAPTETPQRGYSRKRCVWGRCFPVVCCWESVCSCAKPSVAGRLKSAGSPDPSSFIRQTCCVLLFVCLHVSSQVKYGEVHKSRGGRCTRAVWCAYIFSIRRGTITWRDLSALQITCTMRLVLVGRLEFRRLRSTGTVRGIFWKITSPSCGSGCCQRPPTYVPPVRNCWAGAHLPSLPVRF